MSVIVIVHQQIVSYIGYSAQSRAFPRMRRRGKAVDSRMICFVTIHGIGFQHPPLDDIPGYADSLLANVCRVLNQIGNLLFSDDPDRRPDEVGDSVPIDIQSVWTPDSLHIEDGLKRLGS